MATDIEQVIVKLLEFVQLPPSMGRVFFVDPVNGAASNNGAAPDNALNTTQAAVGLCTADHNDIIIRMPGVERPGDVGLDLNVRGITIIGVAWNNPFQPQGSAVAGGAPAYWREVALGAGTASGPAVNITQACTIVGMDFMAANTIALSVDPYMAAVLINGDGGGWNAGYCHIKRCRFYGFGGIQGVGICLRGTMYNLIEECTFEALDEAGIMLETGLIANDCLMNYIEHCNFLGCPFGIDTGAAATAPGDTQVIKNRFGSKAAFPMINGIRTRNVWAGGLITGNYYGLTEAAAIDQIRAVLEGASVYCAGNWYTDQGDPRA